MKGRTAVTVLVALWMVAGGSVAAAQSAPRDAAARFIEAWNARRWSEAAQLLDLDQFDRFRQDFITRARRSGEDEPRMTVADLLRQDPQMPREVAEYQIRMMEEQRRRYADPTPFEFARVSSASVLRNLSPEEAAARWLESRDPRWQVTMQFQQAGCAVPDDVAQIPMATRRLVGTLTEREGAAYAVFREERGDDNQDLSGGDLGVMELRELRGRWVILPRGDLVPEVGAVDVSGCRGGRDR